MDKQITMNGLGRGTIVAWGVALLLAGFGLGRVLSQVKPPTAAPVLPAMAVRILRVYPHPQGDCLTLSGTIAPLHKAVLSTRLAGLITYLPWHTGDRIAQGAVVARIDTQDMAGQTAAARSNVAQAAAEVARIQATLEQLQAQALQNLAALHLAQINQQRSAWLTREGAIPQAQLDQANDTLAEAKAVLAQTKAAIRQARAAVRQAQAALGQAQAQVVTALADQSYGQVVAPFNGVVTEKLASPGEVTNPYSPSGTALIKIQDSDHLQLEVPVPEQNATDVKLGEPIAVQVAGHNYPGHIGQIVPAADPQSRTFLVKVPLDRPSGLMAGMYGQINLPIAGTRSVITIPQAALVHQGQLTGVYVVDQTHQRAELRWLEVGKPAAGQVRVLAGLVGGDQVILTHSPQLQDGQPVRVLSQYN